MKYLLNLCPWGTNFEIVLTIFIIAFLEQDNIDTMSINNAFFNWRIVQNTCMEFVHEVFVMKLC